MLQQIQEYLFQYNSVVIPEVGTFQLSQAPATLDVANQLLMPPSYEIRFSGQAAVPQHQLQTLAQAFDNNTEVARDELLRFGSAFRSGLQQQPFRWEGVGALELFDGGLVRFLPGSDDNLLQPVAAQRVLREHVQHTVLVGDQEMQYTTEAYEAGVQETRTRSWLMVIGWIIALLSIAFIVYHLYISNWAPGASGLRQKPQVGEMPVQHR